MMLSANERQEWETYLAPLLATIKPTPKGRRLDLRIYGGYPGGQSFLWADGCPDPLPLSSAEETGKAFEAIQGVMAT
jgi:hypothetical protein